MVFKIAAKPPPKGESIFCSVGDFPNRVVDFLRESEGERIAVLFKPGKRGRLYKVNVHFREDLSLGDAKEVRGHFEFTR